MPKYNKISECPVGLLTIIEESNLVKPNDDLDHEGSVYKRLEKELLLNVTDHRQLSDRDWTLFWLSVFYECYEYFTDEYKNALLATWKERYAKAVTHKDFHHLDQDLTYLIFNKYNSIRVNRENLLYLAEQIDERRRIVGIEYYMDNVPILEFPPPILTISIKNDKITSSLENVSEFVRAVDGVDVERIRICRSCSRVFWAKRLDAETCGKKCSDEISDKKRKNLNKDEINKRRRRKRYENENIPFCEKCVHPTTKCSCYLKERSKNNGSL